MLSRAYLYMGKNSEALQAAEEAIKGSEANKYQLWNTEEYPTVWGTEALRSKSGRNSLRNSQYYYRKPRQ